VCGCVSEWGGKIPAGLGRKGLPRYCFFLLIHAEQIMCPCHSSTSAISLGVFWNLVVVTLSDLAGLGQVASGEGYGFW